MKTYQIVAPHFTAGIEAEDGRVARAAPILRYMVKWDVRFVRAYCAMKDWKLRTVGRRK